MRSVRKLVPVALVACLACSAAGLSQDLPEPSPSPSDQDAGSTAAPVAGNDTDNSTVKPAEGAESNNNSTKKEGAFEFFFKYRPMPKWGKAVDKLKGVATAPAHVVSRTFGSWAPPPTYGPNYSQWTPQYPGYSAGPYPPVQQPYPPLQQPYAPVQQPYAYQPLPQQNYQPPPQYNAAPPPQYDAAPPAVTKSYRLKRPASSVPAESQAPAPTTPSVSQPGTDIPAHLGDITPFSHAVPNNDSSTEHIGEIVPFGRQAPQQAVEESAPDKRSFPAGTFDDSVPAQIPIDQPVSRETINTVAECDAKARALAKDNHIDEAVAEYQKAFKLDPNPGSAIIHVSAGLLFQKEGKLEDALVNFKQALAYKPQMPEATLGIASTFQQMGQVSHAIVWLQRYLRENPDAKDIEEVQKNLAALKHADSTWEKSDPNAPDYFDTVLSSGDYVWPPYRLPIKVYIQIDTGVPGLRPSLAQMLKDAFNEWTAATGYRLCWVPYPTKVGADIVVRWRGNHYGDRLTGGEGGITWCQKMRYSNGRHTIENATITLWTEDISGQKLNSDEDMRRTTFHEVGHALGVMHSPNNKDVMFFSVASTQSPDLTSRDKATIARMYMYYPTAMQWR